MILGSVDGFGDPCSPRSNFNHRMAPFEQFSPIIRNRLCLTSPGCAEQHCLPLCLRVLVLNKYFARANRISLSIYLLNRQESIVRRIQGSFCCSVGLKKAQQSGPTAQSAAVCDFALCMDRGKQAVILPSLRMIVSGPIPHQISYSPGVKSEKAEEFLLKNWLQPL